MQSAERMSMLIQDLLEFSQLLKSETLMRPIELSEVCKAVINDFELKITEKNAELNIGPLPVIEAVGLQMNQLFYNLLSNALKFSNPDDKPVITISSKKLDIEEVLKHIVRPDGRCQYFQITFADNGIGFEVKYAEQIFEVFKRLHSNGMFPGSGIGLALCRRIVTNHKGYLYAESVLGKGAAFHIILPDKSIESEDHKIKLT
jgi:signal transduction histidine kinase